MLELPSLALSAHLARLDQERRAGWITALQEHPLRVIASKAAAGNATPRNADIARAAGCCIATVKRAKRRAKARQLLAVTYRYERDETGQLWQISNHYQPLTPTEPVKPCPKPPSGRWLNLSHQSEDRKKKERKEEDGRWIAGISRQQNLLEARIAQHHAGRVPIGPPGMRR